MATGAGLSFDTWFNLFNLGRWVQDCALQSLVLQLEGSGQFELAVTLATNAESREQVLCEYVQFPKEELLELDLSHLLRAPFGNGVLFFELRALSTGELRSARWQTADRAQREPNMAIAITTFRREAEVTRTVERFTAFREQSWLKDHVQMIVTDNGQTVDLSPPEGVSLIPNENLGGAGGFTRGLLEARARGATHCLFMDDDASIHMESLERTWMLLAYARDPKTAVAGAMISEHCRWKIWENGAVFRSRCRPLHMGSDLRELDQVVSMENQTIEPAPDNFYGAWWFFAFPLEEAKHLAFPFFVRGDDISFSLANDFNIVTLNGVVSFQESFTEKESPQTLYLDLRSHMAHHLSLPVLDIGRWGVLKIAVSFVMRNLQRMHYDTLEALNLAFEDVMEGPEFFDRNADMAQRRADLKALTRDEAWQVLESPSKLRQVRKKKARKGVRLLGKLTLNGHLIPWFGYFGRRITVRADERVDIAFAWGAREITYLNSAQDRCYTVRHSKRRALQQIWRLMGNSRRFLKDYDRLLSLYRDKYSYLTSEGYWREKLAMTSGSDGKQEAAE
ncbi:glycosyltransferase family 2 protein [Rhodobacteraceae bacterium B1Z28]|uniref:Glycosyltransferase family 2 protein n=1 Tax=Ruegeria haliotis TaxID=2747601 RepID=A0ABX2PU90_9RHOB|nr:glycosyltransferase family 2 protein [Ruegeria haliotis]